MNTKISSLKSSAELTGWMGRGALIALPSAGWAVAAGFTHPVEATAMVLGVLMYALIFAQASESEVMNATRARQHFVGAIKSAVWIKTALLLLAVAYWGAIAAVKIPGTFGWLAVGVVPDMLGGLVSLSLVAPLAGVRDPEAVAHLNSFGWTGLATLTQGALMSLELGLLALGVLAWRKLRDGLVRLQATG